MIKKIFIYPYFFLFPFLFKLRNQMSNQDKLKYNCQNNNLKNTKNRFTLNDDNQLIYLINQFKMDWDKIAKKMNRKKKSCKERYFHYLIHADSSLHWTAEEKLQLIFLRGKLNYNWEYINKMFPSRGPKTIKNQWYYLRKKPSIQIIINQMKNSSINIDENEIFDFSDIFCYSDSDFIYHSYE